MRHVLTSFLAALMVAAPQAVNVGDITIGPVTSTVETDRMTFTGTHPRFSGIGDQDTQKRLNARMAEWEKEALERTKAAAVTLRADDRSAQRKAEGVFGYEVKRNGGGIVSLLFSDYLYAGGANGLDVKTGFSFYSESGEVFALPALFTNSEDGMKRVSEEVARQLKERDLEKELLASFPGIGPQQTFYLTDTDLVIVVQELTWFPHSMGTVEFPLPLAQLKDCLREGIAP